MVTRKTPAEMVDEIMRVGPNDWIPPVKRYTGPEPDDNHSVFYKALYAHHVQETDILYAVIREMYRRLADQP